MIRIFPVVLAALVALSCAKGTPENPILPAGVSPTPLQQPPYVGVGRYTKLGEITLPQRFGGLSLVDFVEVRQPKGTFFAHEDAPGWVYAYQGTHQLSRDGGERTSFLPPAAAAWIEAGVEHFNATSDDQIWYFIAHRPIAQRGAGLPYASYRLLYGTGDLGAAPSGKSLVHQLGYITMTAGGRTSAHSHGGSETFFVLKGTVELATSGGVRKQVTAGQGASVNPGVVMQLRVVGDEPVQILTYFITPEGAPWQNNVQTLP